MGDISLPIPKVHPSTNNLALDKITINLRTGTSMTYVDEQDVNNNVIEFFYKIGATYGQMIGVDKAIQIDVPKLRQTILALLIAKSATDTKLYDKLVAMGFIT